MRKYPIIEKVLEGKASKEELVQFRAWINELPEQEYELVMNEYFKRGYELNIENYEEWKDVEGLNLLLDKINENSRTRPAHRVHF